MPFWFEPVVTGFQLWWEATLQGVTPFVVRVVQILIVALILWIIAARLRRALSQALAGRLEDHTAFLLDRAVVLLVWTTIGAVALAIFGVDLTALAAGVGIATLAFTVAMQDVLRNFIAGVYLLIEQPFRIGQRIKVKEFEGAVQSVSVRVTILRCDDGAQVVVPNAVLFSEAIVNRDACAPSKRENRTASSEEADGTPS
ncbi:MAG: mechanosensitive ion channel [Chloroflexota bacterium]|nr:mechanosensitive ion channel family protein [Dehalococcoidia bacterium]MDW8254793.1 mechanosensitive ion channel [Chloroflexota bacterium]